MKLIDYFIKNLEKFPDKTALIYGNQIYTYSQLNEKIKKLSYGFIKIGIKKNDHIAIILNNSIEFFLTVYTAANLGAVIIPINGSLNKKDLINQIKLTDTKYIVCWHGILNELLHDSKLYFPLNRNHCVVVGSNLDGCQKFDKLIEYAPKNYILGNHSFSEEINFIFGLTSGSTSKPKAVIFSQKTKILRSLHAKNLYKLNDLDVIIVSTPMYHSISQRLIILPIILGGTCVIMEKFKDKNWISLVQKNGVTFSIVVASQLELILNCLQNDIELRLKSIKKLISCCSHLKNETKLLLSKRLHCEIHDTYGASEVGTITNLNIKKNNEKKHTLGKLVPGVEIAFLDETGIKNQPEVQGEILCKSQLIFSGYYKNQSLVNKFFFNEYFCTGDIGYLDQDGYLILTGRKKDIIITGGMNVFASDVEKALNSYPKISESAVIGLQDKRLGEVIFAVVIANENSDLNIKELEKFCASNLADYQQPFAFDIVNDFPRGALNKISKYKLKEKYINLDITKTMRKTLG